MADIDIGIWGLDRILAPAATDRLALETGAGAGGYSERREFAWRDAAGLFQVAGIAGAACALHVVPGASSEFGGIEVYTGGQHEMSLLAKGSTGEVNLSCGRSIGWGGHFKIIIDTLERARFTNAGHFGLGVTPSVRLHAKSSGEIMRLETTAARGTGQNLQTFYDPSGRKGYIGYGDSSADNFYINNEMTGALSIQTGSDINLYSAGALSCFATSTSFRPGADNARTLGHSSFRWSIGYIATGTINTCDVRFKTFRAERDPTEAEHAAALECFAAFGYYQFNDAIAAKGTDGARWHYGPAAQEVWAIFASHGLAAPLGEDGLPPEGSIPPAFLCFDTYPEETAPEMEGWRPSAVLGEDGQPIMVKCAEGEEATEQRPTGETIVTREAGNIFGVRIDQLHSLMLKALDRERKATAADIASLTARVAMLEPSS